MSDEPQAPAQQDTPTEAAPQEGNAATDQQVIDWQKRYEDLRPQWDRSNQELSEYRQLVESLTNPETQADALRALGLELQQEEQQQQQQEWQDPYEQRFGQLEQTLQQLVQRDQQMEQAQQEAQRQWEVDNHLGQAVVEIQQKLGHDIDQKDLELAIAFAERVPDERGMPDLHAAWDYLTQRDQGKLQGWVSSKKAPGIPDGEAAGKEYDLSDPKQRDEYIAMRLTAMDDANVQT